MLIDTILFDVGGVLMTPLDESAVKTRRDRLARNLGFEDGQQMWQRFYCGHEWELTKTGHWTYFQMWSELLTPLGLKSETERQNFLNQLFEGVGLKPEMRNLVKELFARWRLAILSNASDNLNEIIQNRLKIDNYFEIIINSHEVGVAKPDQRIYQIALDRLRVKPQQVFFIDDQLHNTMAAEKLGICGYVFSNVQALRTELARLSLLSG